MKNKLAFLLGIWTGFACAGPLPELARLPYNNPTVHPFLAVGLGSWPLPVDVDGDGDIDLIVGSGGVPSTGTFLFENLSRKGRKEAEPLFKAPVQLSSNMTEVTRICYVKGRPVGVGKRRLLSDFDLKSGCFSKRVDIRGTVPWAGKELYPFSKTNDWVGVDWSLADVDCDGEEDLVAGAEVMNPPLEWDNHYTAQGIWTNDTIQGYVFWFRNEGTTERPLYPTKRQILTGEKPLKTLGRPMPIFADWDGDGDMDLICSDFVGRFTYYENIGSSGEPRYAEGRSVRTSQKQELCVEGTMPMPTGFDWDGDGRMDLLFGQEDGRVGWFRCTDKRDGRGVPLFEDQRYFRQEAAELKFGVLATPCGCDWDGDGDWDLLCGDSSGQLAFIENLSGPGVEFPRWSEPKLLEAGGQPFRIMAGPNGSIQGPREARFGYTTVSVADWDGDGLLDILVNDIIGRVQWFRNIGTRHAPRLAAPQPVEVEWAGKPPELAWGWIKPQGKGLLTQWRTTPVAVDFDRNGLPDLVMMDQGGYLAFFERSIREGRRVLLPPRRVLCDERGQPLFLPFAWRGVTTGGSSGRRKLCVTDWDGDGNLDLLLNGKNVDFLRQAGCAEGVYRFRNMGPMAANRLAGHDTSPTVVDFNGDGLPDLLIGAEDGFFYYLRNPRAKNVSR